MKVVVDTSVWSLALRRRSSVDSIATTRLARLIEDGRVLMLGAVRQELLTGIRNPYSFESLRDHLRSFSDVALEAEDYETAAQFSTICRRHGVQGSNTDFLISAVASRRGATVLTTDKDFDAFAAHIPLELDLPINGSDLIHET